MDSLVISSESQNLNKDIKSFLLLIERIICNNQITTFPLAWIVNLLVSVDKYSRNNWKYFSPLGFDQKQNQPAQQSLGLRARENCCSPFCSQTKREARRQLHCAEGLHSWAVGQSFVRDDPSGLIA